MFRFPQCPEARAKGLPLLPQIQDGRCLAVHKSDRNGAPVEISALYIALIAQQLAVEWWGF